MTDSIFTIDVRWNGLTLEARPELGAGFEKLVGPHPSKLPRVKVACADSNSLTPFEVGMFLATACRQLMNAWEYEQPMLPVERELWFDTGRRQEALPD